MLSFLLAGSLSLSAPAATPRPLPSADSGIYVPRMDHIDGLVAFMTHAGERSVMLRPQSWFSQFHPLVYVDFTRADSLAAAGISRAGGVTVSFRNDGWMSCVELADAAVFEKRAKERLGTLGTLWEGKLSGVSVSAAKTPEGSFIAGYAKKGTVTCSVTSSGNAQALLESATAAVGAPKLEGHWPDVRTGDAMAWVVSRDGAVSLTGTGDGLVAETKTTQLPAPALVKGGTSPYATMPAVGLFLARATVKKEDVPRAVHALVAPLQRMCSKCSAAQVGGLESALSTELTGNVAADVESARVKQKLVTDADRFFAVRHAWLAEVRDAAAVKTALAALASWPGARAEGEGYAIALEGGEVYVGLHGKNLYLANDATVLKAVLLGLPESPGKMAHGAEAVLDPAKASRTLAQISFFDVVGSKELAGLFAASTELGPLLGITKTVTGFADSLPGEKGHRVSMTWTLKPKQPAEGASPTPATAPTSGPDGG